MSSFDAGSIESRLELDRDPFTRGLREARRQADEFAARTPTITPQVDTARARAALESLGEASDELGEHSPTITPDVDTARARAEIDALEARLRGLNGQHTTVNVGGSARNAGSATSALAGLSGVVSPLFGLFAAAAQGALLLEVALAAVAAIAPVVDVALGGILALTGAFVAAASGALLFGGAAITVLAPLKDAYTQLATAQKAYNNATTDKQRQAALAKEKAALDGLNGQQKILLFSVMSLKNAWHDLATSVTPQVYGVLTNMLQGVAGVLPKLKPLLSNTASSFVLLSGSVNRALSSQATQGWLNFLTRQAPAAILTFGHAFGTLGSALGYTLEAFEPLILPAERALTRFVDTVKQRSAGLVNSSGFAQFLSFIRTEAPLVGSTLGALGRGVLDILHAVQPLATPILGFITDFAHAISALTKSTGFATFVTQIGKAFGTLGQALGDNANGIGDFLGSFGTLVADLFRNLAPLLPHLFSFVTVIARFLDKIVSSPSFPRLVDAVGKALDAIGNAINSIPPAVLSGFVSALADLVGLAAGLANLGHGAAGAALGLTALAIAASRRITGAGAGGVAGAASRGGLGGLFGPGLISRVAVPLLITYTVLKTTGLDKQIGDALHGDFAKAIEDMPKWEKGLLRNFGITFAEDLSGSLSPEAARRLGLKGKELNTALIKGIFTNPAGNPATAAQAGLFGNALSEALKGSLDDFGQLGDLGAAHFAEGILNGVGGVSQAAAGLSSAATGSSFWSGLPGKLGAIQYWKAIQDQTPGAAAAGGSLSAATAKASIWDGLTPGLKGAISFWGAVKGESPSAAAAGGALSTAAAKGSIWDGGPPGKAGAVGFWLAISGQTGAAAGAAATVASTTKLHLWFDGTTPGSSGGVGFWQGLLSQAGNAAMAGATLAGRASNALNFDSYIWGANIGANFAAGLNSQISAAAIAGANLAAAVRNNLKTGSPAKEGPLSGWDNAPDEMGRHLGGMFAVGIHQRLTQVKQAAAALAGAARGGLGASYAHPRAAASNEAALREQITALTQAVRDIPKATGEAVGSTVGERFEKATSKQTRDLVTAGRKL